MAHHGRQILKKVLWRCRCIRLGCVIFLITCIGSLMWKFVVDSVHSDHLRLRDSHSRKVLSENSGLRYSDNRWTARPPDENITAPPVIDENGKLYHGYMQVHNLPVFIFSAIAVNSSITSTWDYFVLSGWEIKDMVNYTSYFCCYHYADDTILTSSFLEKRHFSDYIGYCNLEAKQFLCGNLVQTPNILPIGVTLTDAENKCPESRSHYVTPVFPVMAEKPEFVVCAKVVYGNKSASELIEWMEVQRLYGVHKVVLYPFLKDLTLEARRVLSYYESLGFAELIPFYSVPMNETFPRAFGYVWAFEMYNDEQVTLFDCQERLRGYKYSAMIDTDEFITPADADTYVSLMDQLYDDFPDASGFVFLDNMHITSWGPTHNHSDMMITRYQNHTKPEYDTPKNIVRLDRIVPGSLWTHNHEPRANYKKFFAPTEAAVIHHYAVCRDHWLKDKIALPNKCLAGFSRIPGTTMNKIADKIRPNVQKIKQILQITS